MPSDKLTFLRFLSRLRDDEGRFTLLWERTICEQPNLYPTKMSIAEWYAQFFYFQEQELGVQLFRPAPAQSKRRRPSSLEPTIKKKS